jgi:AcrR family transcriptional regulator
MQSESTTEAKILEAARKVFLQKGYYGARMQDIADEAGINKALLHYYFRSKDKLFELIFQEAFATIFPVISQAFTTEGPFLPKLEILIERYLELIIRNPFLPMFVLNEMHNNTAGFLEKYFSPEKVTAVRNILKRIEAAVAQGEIKPVQPRHLLINILSLCVFPFIGRPLLQHVLGTDDREFGALLQERKAEVLRVIRASIT